jgi:lipopolysaccharide heptosyltransferase II
MPASPQRDALITSVSRALTRVWDAWPARRPALSAAPRTLILKPCCLGDVLMATPALAALREHWPAAQIDFAVGGWSRPMLEHNPRLNRLINCGRVGSGPYTWREYWALARRVRAGGYELCLVLDRSPLLALLPALAGVPHRVGLDSDGRGFALTRRVPAAGIRHEADLYLACVQALGIGTAGARLEFYPTEAAQQRVAGLLPPGAGPFVVVHPAGGHNPGMILSAKRWPAERYAALIRRLCAERGARVAIVGALQDMALAEAVRLNAGAGVNLAGRLNFDELGALLQRAALFVGNDTGTMHLAVAVGTPTVAIFGPSDPRQYGPYGPAHRALWKPTECAPCLQHGRWDADCRQFRCIEAISVEDVWAAVAEVLP